MPLTFAVIHYAKSLERLHGRFMQMSLLASRDCEHWALSAERAGGCSRHGAS
jgi:hypothetical protein